MRIDGLDPWYRQRFIFAEGFSRIAYDKLGIHILFPVVNTLVFLDGSRFALVRVISFSDCE